MKAVLCKAFGPAENLVIDQTDSPQAKKGEVRCEMSDKARYLWVHPPASVRQIDAEERRARAQRPEHLPRGMR